MNGREILQGIDLIARERNVDKELLFKDLEQAMESAARRHFNAIDTEEFSAQLDRLSGRITIWRGEEEIPLEDLGRIPAQTAKQVMIQRFREEERDAIYSEFADRVGELVTGTAQRYEGGALVVTVGPRAEGFMPRSEQIPGEQHQPGERVRCLILDVREAGNQVKIVLSRASEDFIRRLFEVEVPEVAERIIEIRAMAREPGHRTKIAVASNDQKVDAVGACVGVRGSRIRNILDELGGEKIDIVRWNEASQLLIQNALKPAEVVEISLCFELGRAAVVVNEDQLSLAIGKRGQNVRLAARLTNWDVDILTPSEFTRGLDTLQETLLEIGGVEEEHVDRLAALGIISVFDVEDVGPEYIMETLGIDDITAARLIALASDRAQEVAASQEKEKIERERMRAQEERMLSSRAGEAQAASILGEAPLEPVAPAEGEAPVDAGGSILDMLEGRQADSPEDGDMRDVDVAQDAAQEDAESAPTEDRDADHVTEMAAEQEGGNASDAIADRTDSDAGSVA